MNRLEDSLRLVDPVDPDAPDVDGEALLREIVATGVPHRTAASRRRRARGRLALVAAPLVAVAASLALTVPARDGVDVVAAAYGAVSQPDTILHYRLRHSTARPGSSGGEAVLLAEVWQAGDGSRLRSLSRPRLPLANGNAPDVRGDLEIETVQTQEDSRTYVAGDDTLIVYDSDVPPLPAPGGAAFVGGELGDPRTLLERAQSGDEQVVELGESTVRGIPVLQFRVGECKMVAGKSGPGRSMRFTLPVVASVAHDDYRPVRIEQDTDCGDAPLPADAPPWDQLPRAVVDYVEFETLPATGANGRLLEMTPHPGARVVDGEDADAAEERADRRAPRPTPTPDAGAGRRGTDRSSAQRRR